MCCCRFLFPFFGRVYHRCERKCRLCKRGQVSKLSYITRGRGGGAEEEEVVLRLQLRATCAAFTEPLPWRHITKTFLVLRRNQSTVKAEKWCFIKANHWRATVNFCKDRGCAKLRFLKLPRHDHTVLLSCQCRGFSKYYMMLEMWIWIAKLLCQFVWISSLQQSHDVVQGSISQSNS